MLPRVLAMLVVVLVAIVAIRLVVGVVSAVLWFVVIAALVAGALWARSALKSAKDRRAVQPPSSSELTRAPGEDRVDFEMRRINEQLREQGRR